MANSNSTEKYKGLKGRLLGTFTPSDYERAGMLINGPDLGDNKPSALMNKMLTLLGDHEPCLLFKRLFLQRLPAEVCAPLLQKSEKDMRKLAEQADLTWKGLKGTQSLLTNLVCEPQETEVNRAVKGKSYARMKDNSKRRKAPSKPGRRGGSRSQKDPVPIDPTTAQGQDPAFPHAPQRSQETPVPAASSVVWCRHQPALLHRRHLLQTPVPRRHRRAGEGPPGLSA